MAKSSLKLNPIQIEAGVQPATDRSPSSTSHYTFTDKIRFRNGFPEKIKGWEKITFDLNNTVKGVSRSLYTEFINGRYLSLIGSHQGLFSLVGTTLTNITPLKTTSVPAANSLDTHYGTLASDPMTSVNGSNFVTVADTQSSRLKAGDIVEISGAVGFGGIPTGDLNGDFIVRSIGVNNFTIYVATAATSSATGGGASVIRASGIVRVNSTAHGNLSGDRVKISGATTFGGITALQINSEFIIRNVLADSFDVYTNGFATSSVTGGGGASTVYFEEIDDGLVDETVAQGYGAGLYGMGLYGTSRLSTTSRAYPRIFFCDRYGDTVVTTAGNQTALYQWMGSSETAPEIITNAPTAVNYAFVQDNILVTFGAGGVENRIFSSDQNDITIWTSSSTNQVFDDDIEGAGRLTSHCPVEDYSIFFTEFKTYKLRYIGLPLVWEISPVDDSIGIIAPMARVSAKGSAYWMGQENFYMFRGGNVEIIPANTQSESTCKQYVFDDLNWGQKSKIFCWYNKQFDEVWWHYPSANSNECNRIARVNLRDYTWTIDTINRSCAEYPVPRLNNPRLIDQNTLYKHEFGFDDDGQPMTFTIRANRRIFGKDTVNQLTLVPDSQQSGTVTATVTGYLWPQSLTAMYSTNYNVSSTTEKISITNNGRLYELTISGSELGQSWEMGTWFEEVQGGASE